MLKASSRFGCLISVSTGLVQFLSEHGAQRCLGAGCLNASFLRTGEALSLVSAQNISWGLEKSIVWALLLWFM